VVIRPDCSILRNFEKKKQSSMVFFLGIASRFQQKKRERNLEEKNNQINHVAKKNILGVRRSGESLWCLGCSRNLEESNLISSWINIFKVFEVHLLVRGQGRSLGLLFIQLLLKVVNAAHVGAFTGNKWSLSPISNKQTNKQTNKRTIKKYEFFSF
jgi:hypothetical protein